MDFQWHQVESFLAAADSPSFSRAAARLYITPSALTQQIASLEASLGFRLFERDNRGARLTPAGEAFREHALLARDSLNETLARCRALADSRRPLAVGCYSAWAWDYLFGSLVQAFGKACPDVDVRCVPTSAREAPARCLRGDFDLFLTTDAARALAAGLECREGSSCNVSAVMSPDNRLCALGSVSPVDLRGQTVLVDDDFCPPTLVEWLVQAGLPEPSRVHIDLGAFISDTDPSHVMLFSSQYADMIRPLENRPLKPAIAFETAFAMRPRHGSAADDFAAFMRGRM